ncbi:MAG: 16S rRNA (adenine(1518)-N(6)/adenine(1519)-N(6))-dimethyltransferase RsmA [Acidobacteriota bacterium]|nr:16S rRNA (adenine(1518)-N(6)/adenine(1519)-N(6))-dimethyltransferase RsmA [Blastocatellia bacterium]MDW8411773.1 16S rRNA (adenine(1518)-N(6)/adenine(1519)-N(6))-dimethyltransferase RsmA [Acidobacteriota bacterium]
MHRSLSNNLRPKKTLGQHFLIDERVTDKILASVAPSKNDLILEIGPGRGALTKQLVLFAGCVIAVELDRTLVNLLAQILRQDNLLLFQGDILDFPLAKIIEDVLQQRPLLKPQARVVANLPYYISTAVIMKLIAYRKQLADMTLMLQEEVADRLLSPPASKDYSSLTVLTNLYCKVTKILKVRPQAFRPVPKVESAVVRLEFKPEKLEESAEKLFHKIVRLAFSQRRKTISNCLKTGIDSEQIIELLAAADIDPRVRAEALSVEDYIRLTHCAIKLGTQLTTR